MKKNLIALFLLITMNSCLYRMPNEDEVAMVPTTNHPELTRQSDQNFAPTVGY